MEILRFVILGIVQGVTEFLPISSSAHLIIVPWLFSWRDQGLDFTVALHVGSLFAILYCFREDIALMVRDLAKGARRRSLKGLPDGKTGFYLLVATLPAVAVGAALNEYAAGAFRDPVLVSAFLLGFGILLYVSDRKSSATKTLRDMTLSDALFFGVAQAFAIFPGVSRAGVTITGGLFRNYRRDEAVRFSFLLAIPVVLAAGVFSLGSLEYTEVFRWSFVLGVLTSFLAALLAIRFLLGYVRKRSFSLFVIYRIVLALVIIAASLAGGGPPGP